MMISQQDIYDIDTHTLQQKVKEIEHLLISSSPRTKKNQIRILGKIDYGIYRFLLKQSQQIQLFVSEFQDQPITSTQPINTKPLTKLKPTVVKQPCTKIFTIPKPIEALRYKPHKDKLTKSPIRKVPSIMRNHRQSLNFVSKPLDRKRANSIAIQTNSKVLETKAQSKATFISKQLQKNQSKNSNNKAEYNIENTQNVKSSENKVQKKKYQVHNNVKFVENQYTVSSDEDVNQNQTFKPELIVLPKTSENTTVETESSHLYEEKQIQNDSDIITKPIDQTEIQASDSVDGQLKNQRFTIQSQISKKKQEPQKLQTTTYADTIDYFRFTCIKERFDDKQTNQHAHENQNQIKTTKQLKSINTIVLQAQFQSVPLQEQKQSDIQILPETQICNTERLMIQPTVQVSMPRPLTRQINCRKVKNSNLKQIPQLFKQLPVPIIGYQDVIPTFYSLFHPDADVFMTMRTLIGVLGQHLSIRNHQMQKQTNLNIQNRVELIQKYGHLVDINLDCLFNTPEQSEINDKSSRLYYRVVKTKQEVYDIITNTLNRANWNELPHGLNLKQSWNLLWTWSKPQIDFKTLIYFQKVNHFTNNKHLSRKDLLKKNIQKIKRLGPKIGAIFDIIPDTYLLPGQSEAFIKKFSQYSTQKINIWIMKPIGLSRGRGIRLISKLTQVYYDEPVVMQRYLQQPLLLDGTKFDMRIYVLVTNINPLEAFIYRQGFARLSTQKYSLDDLKNNLIHLTNFSIQRQNITDKKQSAGGSKISLKMLQKKLQAKGIKWSLIWNQIVQIILKSLIACMNEINSTPNCFQLFGYDIIIDSSLKCWLLEVNSSPSLQKQFALDELIKQQLTDDIIKLVSPPAFDRRRLKEVLQRRVMQIQGRKSYINTTNNTTQQLNQDLYYILKGQPLVKYGQRDNVSNFLRIAPSETYFKLVRVLQGYKKTNIIKKV